MKNLNIKSFITAIVALSAGVWFVIAYVNGLDLSEAKALFGSISQVVTIDFVIVTIFIRWGWKFKIFAGWLVPFPNLNGTWLGHIQSSWIDPKSGKKIAPIPVMLTIKQSFFSISCLMQTAEMRSDSTVEGFTIDQEKQVKRLTYTYTSRPKTSIQDRSRTHDGAIVFEIIENYKIAAENVGQEQKYFFSKWFIKKPAPKLLGRYWTERTTTGEINLKFDGKEQLDEIPSSFDSHPMED